jgi:hypothetical protein
MAYDYSKMSDSERKREDWMNSKWRPMMGWLYMATCTFDFIIFPMIFAILQTMIQGQVVQWQPLTLQGAGLYHIAMGAVLGLAAWGRTQEKLTGTNNGGLSPVSQSFSTYGNDERFGKPIMTPTKFYSANSFGGSNTPQVDSWGQVRSSSKGKPMPGQPTFPEL